MNTNLMGVAQQGVDAFVVHGMNGLGDRLWAAAEGVEGRGRG